MRGRYVVLVGWGCAAAVLGLLCASSVALAQAADTPEAKEAAPESLTLEGVAKALSEYDQALSHLPVISGKEGHLAFSLSLYPNAWNEEVFRRVRRGVKRKTTLPEIRADIAKISKKARRKLERSALFRLHLTHPNLKEELKAGDPQPVHFFAARQTSALKLTATGQRVSWAYLGQRRLDEIKTLRVAHHYTAKRAQRVPYISPVKPKRARWVFWGAEAEWSGLISTKLLSKKRLKLELFFESYLGVYDDRHIIDLNTPSNLWDQDQHLEAEGAVPGSFPKLPSLLVQFLTSIE